MSTERQKKLVQLISENVGNPKPKPIGTLMRKAGYSNSMSKHPARITQTKGFENILKKAGISDNRLATRLSEGLDSVKVVGYLNNKVKGAEKVSDEFVEVPDMYARHKYLLTALELKGHLRKDKEGEGTKIINIIYGHREWQNKQ